MQRKVMTGHKSGLFILLALFFLISCLIMPPPATCQAQDTADTTLTGRITAANTGAGIGAVSVRLSSLANETLYEVKTDDFGFYRMDGLEAGSYIVTAEHPAYQTAQEINFAVNPGANCWDWALQPISGGASLFDVYVEVVCATSGIHLADVPVAITVKRDSDNQFVTYNQATDADGVAHLTGMPAGVYTFTINYDIPNVAAKIGGWDGYISVPFEDISGPHWADVRLKPIYNQLNVTVKGYDVVKDQADMPLGGVIVEASGCDPADDSNVLLPPQVGVSGLTKDAPYWDNSMAGKVKFDKLIPLTWLLETKKLGYENKNLFVRSNSSGGLMQTDVTINIPLEDTKLWVWLDSPYNDPEMLEGLDVILEGITGQNTEGIARRVKAVYSTEEDSTYALFNNILPGNYDVRVDAKIDKTVPIEVDGKKIYDGLYGAPSDKQFTVRFTAQETFYAENDKNTDVTLQLTPEKMKLSGVLCTVDGERATDSAYAQYAGAPAAGKNVEIRLSEYMNTAFPAEEKLHQTVTDASGNFSVELLPGLYGMVVTGMDDYWGNSADLSDAAHPDQWLYTYHAWPYYQMWPYSYESALAFKDRSPQNNEPMSDIGGMPVSSGQTLTGTFVVRKDVFNYDVDIKRGLQDPFEHMVVGIDRSGSSSKVITHTYDMIKNGGQLTLNGPDSQIQAVDLGTTEPSFKNLPAGQYSLTLTHPRYTQIWTPTTTFFDFPSPGMLPSVAFPENYNSFQSPGPGPWPLLPWSAFFRPEYAMTGAIQVSNMMTEEHRVRVMKWTQISSDPVEWDYVEVTGQAYPRFIKTAYTGDLLFETERTMNDPTALATTAYVPNTNYDAYFWWPAGNSLFDDAA
ncbi:MAG TPA: carboxypeptidase-like regulatory domain-containing protein, partial [Syntrophomonas sp.]|nr:carboxypeptidase-like regulatory domain-containing protein [Syntrophomonas sp.]